MGEGSVGRYIGNNEVWTNESCHLTMLGIHSCNQDLDSWKFILEARN